MAYVIAACTVCVTILALAVNSDHFQIYGLTRSYSSCLFLCALVHGSPGLLTGKPAWDLALNQVVVIALHCGKFYGIQHVQLMC